MTTTATSAATSAADFPRLLADVGGTNVRFVLESAPRRFGPVSAYRVADFPSLEAAIRRFLASDAGGAAPRHAAVGLANPITGDQVKLTNHNWAFSIEGMRRSLGLDILLALNDFTALALALPHLPKQGLAELRAGAAQLGAPCALVGPGTGLGVSGLVPGHAGAPPVALAGEGGHIGLTPETDDEWVAWRAAQRAFGHVSAERLLSGSGLSRIHAALAAETGTLLLAPLSPAQVTAGALQRGDPLCQRSFRVFCGLLGSVAADIALVLGARGGVYLGGGIVPRFVDALRVSPLCERFDGKGRMRDYLSGLPIHVITAEYPALWGLSAALAQALQDGG
ncbi:glucokinase [Cupriavidus sp. USMAHM13]|uniref:glucokinase n=1 Tax=Cupriavidus sp. USMAHM13 TaxID=1389192 RepID=UPI0008A672CC|nr:glucokinase [Cupriavidus sp. USMAHM13]AOZ01993.1 glucokinase [Cupriavidus sp. USMAHM13]